MEIPIFYRAAFFEVFVELLVVLFVLSALSSDHIRVTSWMLSPSFVPTRNHIRQQSSPSSWFQLFQRNFFYFDLTSLSLSSSDQQDGKEENEGDRMETTRDMLEAFQNLENLSSLDSFLLQPDDQQHDSKKDILGQTNQKGFQSSSFTTMELESIFNQLTGSAQDTNKTMTDSTSTSVTTEQDFKVYADLLREMEITGEDGIYHNILDELSSSSTSASSTNSNDTNEDNSWNKNYIPIPEADADASSLFLEDENDVDFEMASNEINSNKDLTKGDEGKVQNRNQTVHVLDDADGIGRTVARTTIQDDTAAHRIEEKEIEINLTQETDNLMRQALQEAFIEAKKNAPLHPGLNPQSILNDKEMMKELNAIFDRANEQLLSSLSEIREEQNALSRASASQRSSSLNAEERRLMEAEESVSRLVNKVRKETEEVERAVSDLKFAQETMKSDPLLQAVGLKSAGLVKQGALVGALLFSFRSLGEMVHVISNFATLNSNTIGDATTNAGIAAIVQGTLALACAAYFFSSSQK